MSNDLESNQPPRSSSTKVIAWILIIGLVLLGMSSAVLIWLR